MEEKLQEIEKEAREEHIPVALSDTAMFLANWCSEHKPKAILEIGTAVGYSGIIMLLNSGNDSLLTTIEKDEKSFLKSKENFASFDIEPRVMGYLGDAGEILPWLDEEEKFDLIFLDGPKGQYLSYLPILLKLCKVGGTILADDVNFLGKVEGDGKVCHKHRTIVTNLRLFKQEIEKNESLSVVYHDIGEQMCEITKNK